MAGLPAGLLDIYTYIRRANFNPDIRGMLVYVASIVASVPVPFCFCYAGETTGNNINFPKMFVQSLRTASILLPFCFRNASVMQVETHVTPCPNK